MTYSLKRVSAIFEKDIKDLSKNMFVLTSMIMIIPLAILIGSNSKEPSIQIHYLAINLAFTMVTAFVQCALIIITVIICVLITGYDPANFFIVALAIFISIFFYIALGTLLGLLTKSVMEASVIILPVLILFGLGTFLKALTAKYPQLSFIEYLPNIQLELLASEVQNGAGIANVWAQLAVIAVWVVGACALVVVTYKKRAIDG